jgi:hypothetical protein
MSQAHAWSEDEEKSIQSFGRKILAYGDEENSVTGVWRTLYNEGLRNL